MQYSKYLLILALFLFAYCPATGLAADSRYENIVVGDNIVAQFDKETLRYEKDPYRDEQLLSAWIKVFSFKGYSLNHYLFRLHDRKMLQLETIEYDENGQIISKTANKYNPACWTHILPETISETEYVSALKYSQNNNAQLQREYNERTKNDKKR